METSNNKIFFLLLSLDSRRVRLHLTKKVNWNNNDDEFTFKLAPFWELKVPKTLYQNTLEEVNF